MEELEQASILVALGEKAQEVLHRACENRGVGQEEFQKAASNLAALCVYTAEQIAAALIALRNTLAESVTPETRALSEQLLSLYNVEELFFMVPPHIKHLAYNHPKSRVRNKNWNRMWKIRERYMKWHNQ